MDAVNLEGLENEMYVCIRCAYCFEECPVLRERGWDTDGARGKVILSYGLLTGEIEPSEEVALKLFQCTTCRDCMVRCPSNVRVVDIITAARADLVGVGFATDVHERVIGNIRETGNIYGDTDVSAPVQDGEVPLFIGCQYLSRPNKTKKLIRILEALGIESRIVEEVCCGFPMEVLGFVDDLEAHKERFRAAFPEREAVTMCPTCTVFLREGHGIESRHMLQAIVDRLPDANLGLKVTYHDPCDLSRGLGIIEEPRQVLERLGCDIVEMKHHGLNSRCCGGGGGILMSDIELSDDVALDRVREAIETGADILVTACPTCETVLKKSAKTVGEREGRTIQVRNIEDIIWKGVKG
ncbi:MAG TPA: (Fe-S)-binding protein [Thermoplasmata archaeon]|nr:(Fe-S)-binding protein [Thermoplasmata archaeon]